MEMKISEVMTRDPITISPDTPIRDIAKLMIEKGVGGLPVVDADGNLVGIVTESDLIFQETNIRPPSFVHFLDAYIFVPGSLKRFEERFRKAAAATAEEVMTRHVITVEASDSVEEVAELMVKKKMKRFPVMKKGKLVGIVTMADIVGLLASGSK